jgi:hypothetical protein
MVAPGSGEGPQPAGTSPVVWRMFAQAPALGLLIAIHSHPNPQVPAAANVHLSRSSMVSLALIFVMILVS